MIDDDDGVVDRRNPFDLNQKTLAFIPADAGAASYQFQVSAAGYDATAAQAGTILALQDDDSKQVALPFAFPFFGHSYRQVFVNSDGNVSFTAGDSSSGGRSLGNLSAGVPRIAPLYTDLDPSRSPQGVFITSDAAHFVVSWVQVPVYSQFGSGPAQTFQLRLFPDGRIEMTWQDSVVDSAVVGIAPGRLQGASSVVSFNAGSTSQFAAAIVESFSGADNVDIVATAQKFYQTHEDAYDYLVIFNSEGIAAGSGIVAFEVTARNSRTGYGDQIVDIGQDFGSPKRLQAALNMGPLRQYPVDPNGIVSARFASRDTPLTILGHEAGHLFLAFASVNGPSTNPQPMLGRALVHWSFLFNSEASLLEGNRIQDNGPSASPRFTTVGTVQGYSALDQYLMGFRAPEEVPPAFYVANSPQIGAQAPQTGISFDGQRNDVAVEDVIGVVGRRTPDSTVAQRRFRFAFLLIVPAGTVPSTGQIAQLEAYRSNFELFYQHAASDRATADATLKRAIHLSVSPAAGVLVGSTAVESITLDQPAPAALTVLLHASSGAIAPPSSVTIPSGATNAPFAITGMRAGVDTLTAEPADASYETTLANIQVLGTASALNLKLISAGGQTEPVVARVTDINELPYANVRVTSTLAGAGTADASATSDTDGLVRFHWSPGIGPDNALTLAIANGPRLTVTSPGQPAFSAGSVVNAASFVPEISPGSIATLFGTNVLSAQVSINGTPATVFFTNSSQVNFLAPAELTGASANIVVTTKVGSTAPVSVPVTAISPGIFAAVNRGSYLQIYATGLGPIKDGLTVNQPQVLIGSTETPLLYSGVAPGFQGLYQVNAALPQGLAAYSISLQIAGRQSNSVPVQ
ncbi:MAG: hypothetical protein ACR2NN_10240 [Bryobacteraceae bacterium]